MNRQLQLLKKLVVLFSISLLLSITGIRAQTLNQGDLAVIGWNALTDNVHIVTLVDIPAGTVIKITDRGWDQNTNAFTPSMTGDGIVTWTLSNAMPAGTVLELFLGGADDGTSLSNLTAPANLTASIVASGYSVNDAMTIAGDQIFIYQGSDTNPFFIFGMNNSAGTLDVNNWNTSVAQALRDSQLPNGTGSQNALTNGVNAIGLRTATNQEDNVQYTGPTTTTDRNTWLARITDIANWEGTDDDEEDLGNPITSAPTPIVNIAPPNNAPTDIALSNTSIDQSAGVNAVVGTLTSTDPDASDTHSYTLATGTGDDHNGSFNLDINSGVWTLRANNAAALVAGTYSVRIQTDDNNGGTYQEAFAITVVDDVAPTVSNVAVPANGTYRTGQNLDFTVNVSEDVAVTGTPRIALTIGSTSVNAIYNAGGSTATGLVFRYTVESGETDTDGITVGASIDLNGGTITDGADLPLTLTLNSVGSTAGVLVDGVAPSVTGVDVPGDDTYALGEALSFTVNFNENVVVNTAGGNPRIPLTIGTNTRYATYVSNPVSDALLFTYTVVAGDNDTDGISVGTHIELNGGTIQDVAGNTAALTLNAIGATDGVRVDGVAPTVSTFSPANGSADMEPDANLLVTFSERIAFGTGNIVIYDDAATPIATINVESHGGQLSIADEVLTINPAADLLELTDYYVHIGNDAIHDLVGNAYLGISDNTTWAFTVTDVTAPSGYTVSIDQAEITLANQTALSFTLSGAEVGATFNYTITSDAGGTPVTGSGPVSSANQQVAGIDVSGLSNGALTLSVTLTDVLGNEGTPATDNITKAVNNPPEITTSGGVTTFTESVDGSPEPQIIDPGVTVDDTDNTTLALATVAITSNFQSGEDVLAFIGGGGTGDIDGSYEAGTGVLNLTSPSVTATLAEWEAALQAVTYSNNSQNPNTVSRTVSFIVNDGTDDSAPVTKDIDVVAVNTAPVAVDDALTVNEDIPATGNVLTNDSDVEGDALTASLVTAPANGTVVLNADGSITYTPNSNYNGLDSLIYQVCDNGTPSRCDTAWVRFTVVGVNDPPVVTTSGGITTFTESVSGDPVPVAIDDALTVTDPDNTTLTSATVSITGNFQSDQDVLSFTNDDATMGNIVGSYDTGTGVLTLTSENATATLAEWQAALRSVTYSNTLTTPNTANRTISFVANDGTDDGAAATKVVVVQAVNNAPIITNLDGDAITFTEGGPAVLIDAGRDATVSDPDSPDLNGGNLTVAIVANEVAGEDILAIRNEGMAAGQIGIVGGDVHYGGIHIGLLIGGTGGVDLIVTFLPTATPTAVQALIRNLTYSNGNTTAPTLDPRTIRVTLNDGDGATSAASEVTVNMIAVNDVPTVTTNGGATTFTEPEDGDPVPVTIDPGLTVTDPDNGTLVSATVHITGNFEEDEDLLAFENDGGTMGNIDGSYDDATGIFTLTSGGAAATLAEWEAALRMVTYSNSSHNPNTATRTISFIANDGTDNSGPATRDIIVVAVNTAPVAVDDPVPVNEDIPATGNVLTNDSDVEGNALTASLVTAPVNGTVVLNADGSFTYTPSSNYNGLDSLRYQVCDNGSPSRCDTAWVRFTIEEVNDAPIITAPATIAADEDVQTTLTDISFSDVDAGSANVTATFSVASGTLSATPGGGVTVSGSETGSLTMVGSIANLNAFIAASSLAFTTALNATSDVTLTIDIDDGGHTGTDPGNSGTDDSESATTTVTLVITAINDAPVNTVPAGQTVDQQSTLVFSTGNGNLISVADVDAGGGVIRVTLTATNGLLTLSGTAGLNFLTGSGTDDGTMTFDGTLADINLALNGLTFVPTNGYNGPASLQITTDDLGLTGSGGSMTDTDLISITVNPTNPVVTAVGSASSNGTYKTGDHINLTVTFDQPVTIDETGGSPSLLLETGDTDREAVYDSGSGSNTVIFTYTVQAGDESADLDYQSTAALLLNGATIQNSSGDDAVLTLPAVGGAHSIAGQHDIVVDGVAPAVTAVDVPADSYYREGDVLTFTVHMDDEVIVDVTGGTPYLELTIGTAVVEATYTGDDGSSGLVFEYTVQEGELDTDGIEIGLGILLNGGGLRDGAGNDASLTLAGAGSTENVWVDAVPPMVTSVDVPADGYYREGDVLLFTVHMSEDVTVNDAGGTPYLEVTVGTTDVEANYIGGSGTSSHTFGYTVQVEDEDLDGIALGSDIVLSGGTLHDNAGNEAMLILDGVAPTDHVFVYSRGPSVALSIEAATPVNAPFIVTATFSEAVTGLTLTDITVSNGTLSDLETSDNIVYTFLVTPAEGGNVELFIAANVAVNIADNGNNASNTLSVQFDEIITGIVLEDGNFVYDGTAKSLEIEGDLPDGTTVSYANNSRTDVGTQEVTATLSGDNYETLVLTADLTIAEATITGIALEDSSIVYDGTAKSLEVEGTLPEGVTVEYADNNRTDVGTQEVTATLSGDNYETLVLTADLTITEAAITGITLEDGSFVYDGTAKSLTITGDLPDGTTVSYTGNSRTDVGTQEVTATISGDNYEDLVLTADLTITEATITGITLEDGSFVYDGTAKSLTITGDLPDGTTVSYIGNSHTDVGTQEVTATISGDNYEDLVLTAKLTITAATITGITLEDGSFVYDGTAKSLEIEGDLPDGTTVSYTGNSRTDVGTQEVTATISGDNYEDLALTADLTITEATITGITLEDGNFVYDGTTKSLAITGDLPNGTMVSYTGNSRTDVGTQEVTATISGDNYEDLVLTADLTITAAAITGITLEDGGFVYDGTAKSLEVEGDLPDGTKVSYTGNSRTDVGTQEVTATVSGDNYEDLVLTADLTISGATITGITLEDGGFVYDGTAKSLEIEGDLPDGTSVSYTGNSRTDVGTQEVTATVSGDNYEDLVLTADLTITAATITGITLEDGGFVYDGTAKSLEIEGDLPNGTKVSYTGNRRTDVGTQEATATISGDNYQRLELEATLTITPAERSIDFPPLPAKTYGDGAFDAGATASSGETVLYTSSDASVAEVDADGLITINGAGTTTITASVPENGNYSNRPAVSRTLVVGKSPQTVVFEEVGEVHRDAGTIQLEVSASSGLAVSLSVDDPEVATVEGTTLLVHRLGTVRITATQAGDGNHEAAEPVTITVRVVDPAAELPMRVTKVVSPNGDGINEFLLIEGIKDYPENNVMVFNRNGTVLYEAKGYNNGSIAFRGISTGQQLLPAGTYFYVAEIRVNGIWKYEKGWFVLRY